MELKEGARKAVRVCLVPACARSPFAATSHLTVCFALLTIIVVLCVLLALVVSKEQQGACEEGCERQL